MSELQYAQVLHVRRDYLNNYATPKHRMGLTMLSAIFEYFNNCTVLA